MPRTPAEKAAKWLLEAIPTATDPTKRGLGDECPFDRGTVSIGLRRLRTLGLAVKQPHPWNPKRKDLGNGWELTPEGERLREQQIAARVAYEIQQFRS